MTQQNGGKFLYNCCTAADLDTGNPVVICMQGTTGKGVIQGTQQGRLPCKAQQGR